MITEKPQLFEAQRLACLKRYEILDTPPAARFDQITALVASLLEMPIAMISLVDRDRIVFKSRFGSELKEAPRDPGLCSSAITGDQPWIVNDASTDPRTRAHPLVTGAPALRFYAAAPLRSTDGFNLGTLCVIDQRPRDISLHQLKILEGMATLVMDGLELHLAAQTAAQAEREFQRKQWSTEAHRLTWEADSRRQLALDAAQAGDWELDLKTRTATRSLRHDQCFGYAERVPEWNYEIFLQHVHPEDREHVDQTFQAARNAGNLYDAEFRVIWPDGTLHWLLSRGRVLHDNAGIPIAMSGILVDTTERKQTQVQIERLAFVANKITTAVMTTDASGNISWTNGAFTKITGYTAEDALGRQPGTLLQGPDTSEATVRIMRNAFYSGLAFEVDVLNYRKGGIPFWLHVKADPISAAEPGKWAPYIAVQTDITERKKLESELWTKANFDGLTLLPNRRLFWDRLRNQLHHAHRAGSKVALLFIDLDRFKEINDLHGHEHGDQVLLEVSRRIQQCIRESDTAARLGGDEFAVILSDFSDCDQVDLVVGKLLAVLSEATDLQGVQCTLSASIGVTLFPDDAANAEQLFNNADQAMYMAKNCGRNRFSYFTPSMQQRSERRLRIGHDLRLALEKQQLTLYFQPIVDLATNQIVKAEALLRWSHPVQGFIDPAEFIPMAEELGLIDVIGEWVFEQAAHWAHTWSEQCDAPIQVGVNKSAMQFGVQNNKPTWPQKLQAWGIPGRQLSVEITEGILLKDSAAVMDTLEEYRLAGIEVALDDFGTGYSSMAYLKKFNIDYLKIDQSFIQDIESANSRTIVEAIIVMGQKLGLKIIAEGIETERQRAFLATAGCNYGQGYLFSHPLAPDVFTELLRGSSHFSKSGRDGDSHVVS